MRQGVDCVWLPRFEPGKSGFQSHQEGYAYGSALFLGIARESPAAP